MYALQARAEYEALFLYARKKGIRIYEKGNEGKLGDFCPKTGL